MDEGTETGPADIDEVVARELADVRQLPRCRSRPVLPGAGCFHERGEAGLPGLRRTRGLPRVRVVQRREVRHLGWAQRAGASADPSPACPRPSRSAVPHRLSGPAPPERPAPPEQVGAHRIGRCSRTSVTTTSTGTSHGRGSIRLDHAEVEHGREQHRRRALEPRAPGRRTPPRSPVGCPRGRPPRMAPPRRRVPRPTPARRPGRHRNAEPSRHQGVVAGPRCEVIDRSSPTSGRKVRHPRGGEPVRSTSGRPLRRWREQRHVRPAGVGARAELGEAQEPFDDCGRRDRPITWAQVPSSGVEVRDRRAVKTGIAEAIARIGHVSEIMPVHRREFRCGADGVGSRRDGTLATCLVAMNC